METPIFGGNVSCIYSKDLKKEMLAAPVRLALSNDTPRQWSAWNMDFDQEQAAPPRYVTGPAKIEVIEGGPVRAGIEVLARMAPPPLSRPSVKQTISVAAGDAGKLVEFGNVMDWHERQSISRPPSGSPPLIRRQPAMSGLPGLFYQMKS